MNTPISERISRRFSFVLKDGTKLFPICMKRRANGHFVREVRRLSA
jgi:hypothetical protein